jgi:hypothetical protein
MTVMVRNTPYGTRSKELLLTKIFYQSRLRICHGVDVPPKKHVLEINPKPTNVGRWSLLVGTKGLRAPPS